jgi:hypothetical protein
MQADIGCITGKAEDVSLCILNRMNTAQLRFNLRNALACEVAPSI